MAGVPDVDLSRADKKLLQVAVESGAGMRLTVEDLAEMSGRSVKFVYERLMDPQFRSMFYEALRSSMTAEVPAILNKFAALGREGSFKHGKLILEISGMYNEESTVNVNASVTSSNGVFKSEQEKDDFFKATLVKYIESPEQAAGQVNEPHSRIEEEGGSADDD